MSVTQISVFMQDKVGRLSEICGLLGKAGLNIRGFSIADTAEGYGILNLITGDPERTVEVLKEAGFTVSENQIVCVDVPDEPGGLARVLRIFSGAGINVHNMYATAGTKIAFAVEPVGKALAVLKSEGVATLSDADIATL
ncbi:MAG TPA: ACT domain-containing protein [Alphaproteobacteria bacterium]|nr:ACT domain-containing protein [Alphaproteobacteria bacterium]